MSAARHKRFPVRETGVYLSERSGRLEYWFCAGPEHRTMIGACATNLPPSLVERWEMETSKALLEAISKWLEGGTTGNLPADVLRAAQKAIKKRLA